MDVKTEEDLSQTRSEIDQLRKEVKLLNSMITEKEAKLRQLEEREQTMCPIEATPKVNDLTNEDIERYSRQLIVPNFGVAGQLKLKAASVLIVGMGGLGCPAAQYLAAAGCGCIGVVDYDNVDRSNLHRQVLHSTGRCNYSKVESAQMALKELNPYCTINEHYTLINNRNALELLEKYDLILDCSDNVATRYLLNDACVMLQKPLISGSALQLDGQLTVYNYGDNCPCYRCLFPVPPPPETVTNCGDGGILGAVTGVIGSMQALEAIKIIVGLGNVLAGRLLLFDALQSTFRTIKLRGRRTDCDICSEKPIITHLLNYEQYCGSRASDKDFSLLLLQENQRCSVREYNSIKKKPHLLIDVRSPMEFEICRLPCSVNVPLQQILDDSYVKQFPKELEDKDFEVIVVCRRGNDSQIAAQHMLNKFPGKKIRDLEGGLHAWHKHVDKDFPIY